MNLAARRGCCAASLVFALSARGGSDKSGDVSGGNGGAGGSTKSYTLCDGSDDMRVGVVSEGGAVESTYEHTNPYGHSFLFIDGHCHYYASASWMRGVVQAI